MTSEESSKLRIALVGAGTVGTAVAYLLSSAGHQVIAIASRSLDSALRASERLGADVYRLEDLPSADLVLMGVPDDAITNVAGLVAERVSPGSFVVHFAGAFGPALLRPVAEKGASACAIHPVQACPSIDVAIDRLPGSAWAVTCLDPGAEELMIELIDQDLRGIPFVIPEDARSTWHAAAAMTSNGVAALLAAGEELLAKIGVEEPMQVLGPLVDGTIRNAREAGGGAAVLTGPIVRGDVETLRRHLRALVDQSPEDRMRYKMIATLIIQIAQSSGRISQETAAEVMRVIVG